VRHIYWGNSVFLSVCLSVCPVCIGVRMYLRAVPRFITLLKVWQLAWYFCRPDRLTFGHMLNLVALVLLKSCLFFMNNVSTNYSIQFNYFYSWGNSANSVATRAAYFDSNLQQIVHWLRLCDRLHWGSLQRSPDWFNRWAPGEVEGRKGKWEGNWES